MPLKIDQDGTEVEVYTAEDVQAKVAEEVKKKETEFGAVKTKLETDLAASNKRGDDRAREAGNLRKLSDDQVAALSVAERTIYENQQIQIKKDEERAESEKKARDAQIDTIIRSKVGTDEKAFAKVKEMWALVGIETPTPADMEKKALYIIGGLKVSEPDLVASVMGFAGGSYVPPTTKKEGDESFAETEKGKAAANDLGLILEVPKKK